MKSTEEEKDIIDIAEIIFSRIPENKNTIKLNFEDYSLEQLYEDLLKFFTYGMKIKYGDENGIVHLKDLNNTQLTNINLYMNMIGVNFHYNIYKEEEYDKMINENFLNKDKSNLENFRFKLKSENIIYIIYFSLL